MNRHPYGGYDGPRRGASPQNSASDRRFGGGRPSGRGRGGGGRGGPPPSFYDNDYDYNNSQAYNVNGSNNDDPYYYQGQGQHMGVPPASAPFSSAYGTYDLQHQDYGGTYEDKDNSTRGGYGGNGGSTRGKRPAAAANPRKERDDKIHDSLIEERIQRERPCRTLFIRNIKYETDSDDVRHKFEEHGEIKTFFDLISNRGMVFVTYFDIRAAERARERLQGSEISGRPIDVHYSLPRGDEQRQECDRDKNQGTVVVTLRNSLSGQIDDTELRRKFQQFGDVKSIRYVDGRADQRYVEMYDIRATEQVHDRLRHQSLGGGVMDIAFTWDIPDTPLPPGPLPPTKAELRDRYNDPDERPSRGRGGGRGRGGRGGGGGGGSGGGGRDSHRDRDRDPRDRDIDDWERDRHRGDDWGRDRGRRHDDGPRAPPPPPARGRYDKDDGYGPSNENTLEKAKKVQELLAALKPGASAPPPATQQPPAAAPPRMTMPPAQMPPPPQPPVNHYYSQPNVQPPSFIPPSSASYGYQPTPQPQPAPVPQHSPTPPAAPMSPVASGMGALPPNILALLQQVQLTGPGSQPPPAPSVQQYIPTHAPSPQAHPSPANANTTASLAAGLSNTQMQQLLTFMQATQKRT